MKWLYKLLGDFNSTDQRLYSNREVAVWIGRTWSRHKLQATLNTAVGIAIVLTKLAFVWATKICIDIATGHDTGFGLRGAGAMLVGLIVLEITLAICARWIKASLGVRAVNVMKRDMFTHLLMCEWTGLKRFHSGDLINRSEKDVATVTTFLTDDLPYMITTVVQFLGAFLFLFYMNSTLALIVAVILPVFILISKMYFRRMRELTHEVRTSESKIQSKLQESVQHRAVIKALSRSHTVIRQLNLLQLVLRKQVLAQTRISTFTTTLMNIGFSTGYLVAFFWGVVSLREGIITYGSLMAFIQLVGQIQVPAREITRFIPKIIGVFTAGERLMELYEVKEEALPSFGGEEEIKGAIGIELKDVSYSYTPASRKIFEHLDISIPPGSKVAVVGETGVGKTTLIRLLLAFVKPTTGHIYIKGEDKTAEVKPGSRINYAYVPQGNTLFSGTIGDNLRMGNPFATEADMYEALRMAQADFVASLPDGLDTRCGELGDGLSEGQAQRIAIARALLHEGGLLLLDEATSALDADTEEAVVQRLIASERRQTILCITHRLGIIKHCTHIIRISRGGVKFEENIIST